MSAVLGQRSHVQRILWDGLFRLLLKASWVLVRKYRLWTHTKTRGEFIYLLVRQLGGVFLGLVLPHVCILWVVKTVDAVHSGGFDLLWLPCWSLLLRLQRCL